MGFRIVRLSEPLDLSEVLPAWRLTVEEPRQMRCVVVSPWLALCSFVVGTDGRVSNICVIRGTSDETLNREAVRVISEMPRWKAGRIGRNAVPVRVVLPVSFRF